MMMHATFPMAGIFGLLFVLNFAAVAYFCVFVESEKSAKQIVIMTTAFALMFCAFYAASDSLETFKNMGPTIALFLNLLMVLGMTNLWDASQPQRWG